MLSSLLGVWGNRGSDLPGMCTDATYTGVTDTAAWPHHHRDLARSSGPFPPGIKGRPLGFQALCVLVPAPLLAPLALPDPFADGMLPSWMSLLANA